MKEPLSGDELLHYRFARRKMAENLITAQAVPMQPERYVPCRLRLIVKIM
jgi:hypothetical protein